MTVLVHLKDGRVIDVTALAPKDVVFKLRALGVRPPDIEATVHHLGEALPAFTCPLCGRRSYNRNDVEQRYCGACHVFVDDVAGEGHGRKVRSPSGE